MTATSAIMPNRANFVTADHCANRRRSLQLNAAVMRLSRDLFPIKTAHYLAEITGYSLRTCEYWLSEKVVIPSDALATLLQSDQGREFLAVVMADATPRWWKQLKAWLGAASCDAAERKLRRKKKAMLDALMDERADVPLAQVLFDEEFYSGQPSPHRGPRRSVDR